MIGERLKKNSATSLYALYIKEIEICPALISKINSSCRKSIIILMIPNKEKEGWYCLAVKTLSALIKNHNLKKIVVILIV